MKTLAVDDDLTCRKLLGRLLGSLGLCDIAVNGEEAVILFEQALAKNAPYHLICLDIMMPGLDGQGVLKKIRSLEEEHGIRGLDQAKIIMTTALNDRKNILEGFRSQCDGYLVKPIRKTVLFEKLEELGLLAKAGY